MGHVVGTAKTEGGGVQIVELCLSDHAIAEECITHPVLQSIAATVPRGWRMICGMFLSD